MSDEKALLAAIWEHPYEDTPRLMYADWLQEHGQPERAEFIRVQTELARRDEDAAGYDALFARQAELWASHRDRWVVGLPDDNHYETFVRGFAFPSLRRGLSPRQFLKVAKRRLQTAPLWSAAINWLSSEFVPIMSDPKLQRVGKLELGGADYGFGVAEALAASDCARNVAELFWDLRDTGAEVLHALARPGALPNLRRLRLYVSAIDDGAASALARSPLAERLTALTLPGATGATVRALFAGGQFVRLTELLLSGLGAGDALLAALAACRLPALRRLWLPNCGITPAGAEALAGWRDGAGLRRLLLNSNWDLRPAGIRALADSPYLHNLVALDVNVRDEDRDAAIQILTDRFGSAVQPYQTSPLRGGPARRLPTGW